jgi:hypothetical protein
MLWKLGGLATAALIIYLAVESVQASHALQGPGIIRLTDREIAFSRVDNGRRRRSPGDMEITRRLLYNKGITPKPIGNAELVCTYTGGNKRSCTGTYHLPAGNIVVGGPMLYGQLFQLAVVGGTGRYNNVKGTMTVTSIGRRPRRDVVIFRLVV